MFLYFLPRVSRAEFEREPAGVLRAHRLAETLADCLPARGKAIDRIGYGGVATGPGGLDGVVIFAIPVTAELPQVGLGYYPDQQTWRPIGPPDKPQYWLGWNNASAPNPESLRRVDQVDGYPLVLGDGESWIAPILRRVSGQTNLPCGWGCDATGAFVSQPLPEFKELWTIGEKLWQFMTGRVVITTDEAFPIACKLLGVNYRVGPHEASALSLISSTNGLEILRAAIDLPLFEELLGENQKKSTSPSELPSA